ncbi:MAG: GNAT family N-acetyltransferase [Bdellovibrionaceae bacterium]|nr:GNAT family N-acetyltransferase [Pseudobdellovibrionaceae bacterium]
MIRSLSSLSKCEQGLVFASVLAGFENNHHFPWTTESLQQQVIVDEGLFWEIGGEAVGFVIWRDLREEGEILTLASALKARRMGYMEKLLLGLFDANSQVCKWWIEVHELNLGALNLYTKMGFQKVSERRGYYSDGASALILGKTITP